MKNSTAASHGGADVGGGLAAMLSSELARSDRFILVERPELVSVLREQQLALGGLTTADACAGCAALCATACLYELAIPERMRGAHALLSFG